MMWAAIAILIGTGVLTAALMYAACWVGGEADRRSEREYRAMSADGGERGESAAGQ